MTMLLDFQFSLNYYLRVIELVIRDASRILVYDKKRHLLEAWPIDKSLSERYDTRAVTLQKALQLLFSSFAVPYSVLVRLLAIIDVRLREESRHIGVFCRIFRPEVYKKKNATIEKLLTLRTWMHLERQRPLEKISQATCKVFSRKGNFSSWEDFSHEVQADAPSTSTAVQEVARENLSLEAGVQMVMEALLTVLESQATFPLLSLELLELFLAERAQPLLPLSDPSFQFLHNLELLFISNRGDFQTLIMEMISPSNDILDQQLLSPQGKALAQFWQNSLEPRDLALIQGFLSEVVRKVVTRALASLKDTITPEHIGNIYSIRDSSLSLWIKMMRILLARWLLDFDQEVFSKLKHSIEYYRPRSSWRHKLLKLFMLKP